MSTAMPNQASQSREDSYNDDINLLFFVNLFKFHKLFITIVILLCLFIGGLYAGTRPAIYESKALIKVVGDSSNSSNLAALLGITTGATAGGFAAASPADVQTSLIESDYVMSAVAERLGLNIVAYPNHFPILGRLHVVKKVSMIQVSEFSVPKTLEGLDFQLVTKNQKGHYYLYGPNGKKLLEGVVGQRAHSKDKHFPISIVVKALSSTPKTIFIVGKKPLNDAAHQLLVNLMITAEGEKTGILKLSYRAEDPEIAQKILNTILTIAVEKNVAEKAEEATKTLTFLKDQLPSVTQDLDTAEKNLNIYRSKTGTLDNAVEAQILLQEIVSVEENIDDLNLKKLELQESFTAKHPYILAIDQKENKLEEKLASIKEKLKEIPLTSQQTMNLERNIKVHGEIYSGIMQNMQQMQILKGSTVSSVRILNEASFPVMPIASKTALFLLVSILAGIFFSLLILILRHMFTTALDPLMLEKYLGIQLLATVPYSNAQEKLVKSMRNSNGEREHYLLCLDQPKDQSIEALRSLRTALRLLTLSDVRKKIIAFSGCSPGVGKSYVSSNFASLLSDLGSKVLLIDADMRKGYLRKIFSCRQSIGLSEYLNGTASLDQSIQKALPNVDFIATGIYPLHPAELLMHRRMQILLEEVSKKYDFIIIDTPPILAVTDASLIMKQADIRLLVIGCEKDHLREIEYAKGTLAKSGIVIDGLICNNLYKSSGQYGYDGYNYNYSYK